MVITAPTPTSALGGQISAVLEHYVDGRCNMNSIGKTNAILEQTVKFRTPTFLHSLVCYAAYLIRSLYEEYTTPFSTESNSATSTENRWALIYDLLSRDESFVPPTDDPDTLKLQDQATSDLLHYLFRYFCEAHKPSMGHTSDYTHGVITDIHTLFASHTMRDMLRSRLYERESHRDYMSVVLAYIMKESYTGGWFQDACSLIAPIRDILLVPMRDIPLEHSTTANIVHQWCDRCIKLIAKSWIYSNGTITDYDIKQALRFVFTDHCASYLDVKVNAVATTAWAARDGRDESEFYHTAPIFTILLYKITREYHDGVWVETSEAPDFPTKQLRIRQIVLWVSEYAPNTSVLTVPGTFCTESAKKITLSAQEILKRCADECDVVL